MDSSPQDMVLVLGLAWEEDFRWVLVDIPQELVLVLVLVLVLGLAWEEDFHWV